MKDRPRDIGDAELRRALRAWEIDAVSLAHAPVGFGDHHWTVTDAGRRRWFVTVADLAHKNHCGAGPAAAFDGLRRAMDTAAALRVDGGLDAVVAPVRTAGGETLRPLGDGRYGISVFPQVDGEAGEFGDPLTGHDRGRVLDLLARLHTTPPPAAAPRAMLHLPARAELDSCLAALDRPWAGGPHAEPARELTCAYASVLRRRLDEFDRRAAALGARDRPHVVTHGEPHSGNLLRRDGQVLLVDWDTVGTGLPERDLWHVVTGPDDCERYAGTTGRRPDPEALAFFRLRWALDDVAAFLAGFRGPHDRTPDVEESWTYLTATLASLASDDF
ncbi:phosphotransferase enzyme family protein [Streptomyces sp. NPDC059785]|uniref:phosphotransferase enzyme family protein n=1 Tax=Streptomyces sp. NPDC059785 TaxID=3346945 RepID=UPI0036695C59